MGNVQWRFCGAGESTTLPAEIESDDPAEVTVGGSTDKHAKYEDVPWANLPDRAREAAETIGFNEDTWDGKEWLPIDDKRWKHLTDEELEACTCLDWTRDSWDTKYEDVYWKSLPYHVKRACAIGLTLPGRWDSF